ncbi:MAG TPA: transglutaminaseTgpA domain-containing protein [Candidatus Limnocylindrales bacterium]
MTTYQSTRGYDEVEEREWSPAEGWTTVILVGIMLLALGVAVDSSRWVGSTVGGDSRTGFLPFVLIAGAVWGFAGAKSRLPALAVHAAGAVFGTVLVIILVAGVNSAANELTARIAALSLSLDRFGVDLLVRQVRSSETAPFLLVTGCIAWATGAYAAFAIFRRHRPMDALVVCGLLLLANLSLTYEDVFAHLVIFAAAALLLLVRANLDEQRNGWARRRIGDAGHVSSLFMRSGLTFVAVALAGAVFLTSVASSAPLAAFWNTYQSDMASIGQELNRLVGGLTAPARGPNALFSSSQTVLSRWVSDPAIAYLAEPSDGNGHYWRVATYDQFDGTTWRQTERFSQRVEPGQPVLGGSIAEIIEPVGRYPVTVKVTAIQPAGDSMLAPDAPYVVQDRAINVWLKGEGGSFATADLADGMREGDTYTVDILERKIDEETGLNESFLRRASPEYPLSLAAYGDIQPGSVGATTTRVAKEIVDSLPEDQRDAYSVAKATQDYLRSPSNGFIYQTDVTGQACSGQVVDCFLDEQNRRGFCQQFASAMVMLLRENRVASRLAMGYLPGEERRDGVWEIDRAAAHAWVEVYFPGAGWVRFDPTPGSDRGRAPTVLPPGPNVPAPSAGASASRAPSDRTFGINEPGEDRLEGGTTLPPIGGPGGGWLAIALVGILAAAFVIAGWSVRERRKPLAAPDAAFGGVARLAARFGYGQRPTQTTYEYATALGEVIPAARDELSLVARVKVETQYARRTPSPDVMLAVRHAYRRIRVRLLALIVRRPARRR